VHQVGLKDSGSRNFSFLAAEGAELASTQIFSTTVTATATARDRRKFFIVQIMFFIHKKSKKVKISEKKFSSTLNQYFPHHIPYVASKKCFLYNFLVLVPVPLK
jgi:hypothetical protein